MWSLSKCLTFKNAIGVDQALETVHEDDTCAPQGADTAGALHHGGGIKNNQESTWRTLKDVCELVL